MQVFFHLNDSNSQEMVQENWARDRRLLNTTLRVIYVPIPMGQKVRNPVSCLANIKQGPNETLKAYVRCFNEELATIHNPQENGVLMAVILGVRLETPFWDKLEKDECKMM